jgi:hypothetical protein
MEMDIEQLGLVGVFIAGAIPWFEAIAVVPTGIVAGLNPVATVLAAILGNALTIFIFAYAGSAIRQAIITRRIRKGKHGDSPKFEKALTAFDRYGIYAFALLGPILIGTQFAAAAAVAAGVKPLKAALLITAAMVLWAIAIAVLFVSFGFSLDLV